MIENNDAISNKIVKKPVKVDFHIHSCFSITKDSNEVVGAGTIENLPILVSKLNEYEVNMAAITDHDCFSYEMYKVFKSHEGEGSLLKVLPGVEFSLGIYDLNNNIKTIHVIAIFDDKNDEKIQKIDDVLKLEKGKPQYNDLKSYQCFSESELIEILRKIDLNVVLIAHQKNSVTSDKRGKNDLNNLGEELFNIFLTSEVFEALEFKSFKNGLFNNIFAREKNKEINYDIVKFITGSDCHQWACYPKHDGKESDEAVSYFKHTYLKCLPTFKGLTMALSDYSRIQLGDSFFSVDNRKIKEIKLEVNGNKISIPLSDGINAIIGDNSIGKSLLLHKLTNYKENAVVDEKTKKGYEDYLKTNSVDIQSRINECDLYYFDFQGSVRQRFEDKSGVRNQEFLNQKFPDAPCNEKYIKIIQTEFEKLYECIETKFAFDEEYAKLKTLRMIDKDITARMISCNKIMNNQTSMKGYSSAYKYIDSIISKIDDPKKYSFIEQQDAQNIIKIKDYLTMLSEKYHKHYDGEKRIYDIKNLLNEGIANYNEYAKAYKDEDTKIKEQFEADSVEVASTLMELVKLSKKIKKFAFDITEPIEISPNSLNYNDYVFVKRFKNIKRIDNEYLRSVLNSCIKAKKEINTETITKKGLEEVLKDYDPKVEPLTFLKDKIGERISSDFQIESVILKKDIDQYTSLSNGLNATIYFDIISGDEKQGIYIVDQPEDDVSQKAIKDRLITDFKKMSEKRQIILVTHNPQFVVNLDVDNVICIHKNKGEIAVSSGALEFENEKDNIIQIVADNLDGGVDAIKKRWKRYGKEI